MAKHELQPEFDASFHDALKSTPSAFELLVVGAHVRIRLPIGKFVIGRHPKACHMIFHHLTVSRQHCGISISAKGVRVTDLNSSNGTLVNGSQIHAKTPMQIGDTLKFGAVLLKLREASTDAEGELTPKTENVEIEDDMGSTLPGFAVDVLFELDD